MFVSWLNSLRRTHKTMNRLTHLLILLLVIVVLGGSTACAQLDALLLPADIPTNLCMDETAMFRDEFELDAEPCGWVTFNAGSEVAQLTDSAFRITTSVPGQGAWTYAPPQFADMELNLQTTQLIGTNDNAYGAICRYVDENNFYVFFISGDGYYAIGKFESGNPNIQYLTGTAPEHFVPSAAINTGASLNRLMVSCMGDRLTLGINGEIVTEVRDTSHAVGRIGLMATTFQAEQTEIEFDNIVVTVR